ncbi:hypothetical protein B0T14DRAFT_399971, partial [Immersiella caudata]
LATAALLFLSSASAHFVLVEPPSLEGGSVNEDKQGTAPCGGTLPDLSKRAATDFYVDGDNIALRLGHPQAKWLIRGTLEDQASGNWTQLFPIVLQSGLGNFCEPIVTAPSSWVNKTGVIGIVSSAPDGTLYQCAVVNFVAGSAPSRSENCVNGSAVTGDFTSDATLSGLVGNPPTTTNTPAPKPGGSTASTVGGGLPIGSLLITGAMAL